MDPVTTEVTEPDKLLDISKNPEQKMAQCNLEDIVPIGTFTVFPNLPTEIRLKVWGLYLNHPQIITLTIHKSATNGPTSFTFNFWRYVKNPRLHVNNEHSAIALLHTNHESRSEAKKIYRASRIFNNSNPTFINHERDTLFFASPDAFYMAVKSIAFDLSDDSPAEDDTTGLAPRSFKDFKFLAVKLGNLKQFDSSFYASTEPPSMPLVHRLNRAIRVFGNLEELLIIKVSGSKGEEDGIVRECAKLLEIAMDPEMRCCAEFGREVAWKIPKFKVVTEEEMRAISFAR